MSSVSASIDPRALAAVRLRVGEVLDEIRPSIQEDGGDIELVDVTPAGEVRIRLKGACVGCPSSGMTLHDGIERNLRAIVPEVRSVVAVEEASARAERSDRAAAPERGRTQSA